MAKIWTDDEEIEVCGMDVCKMEEAMRFKARHIRAKADPELFENVADALVMLWKETKNRIHVVRCKDCKYSSTERAISTKRTWCDYWAIDPDFNDFCSHGERKDGDRANLK